MPCYLPLLYMAILCKCLGICNFFFRWWATFLGPPSFRFYIYLSFSFGNKIQIQYGIHIFPNDLFVRFCMAIDLTRSISTEPKRKTHKMDLTLSSNVHSTTITKKTHTQIPEIEWKIAMVTTTNGFNIYQNDANDCTNARNRQNAISKQCSNNLTIEKPKQKKSHINFEWLVEQQ